MKKSLLILTMLLMSTTILYCWPKGSRKSDYGYSYKPSHYRHRGTNTGIPGLSFSWKRAVGITRMKRKIARATGIPTTRQGRQAKIGRMLGF
jgi:hypothetical protein